MSTIKLPQLAWYGPKNLELAIPDGWQAEIFNMAGYARQAMTDAQIKHAINNPIGSPTIRELARGKKEVVIIFDDIARVTRVSRIVPFVLEELAAAGIPESKIRFIAATATHAAMSRDDFAKKLGNSVLARFRVYNHNPFDNCTYVGTTSRGTRVSINTEFMKCDLRIAIGSISPHIFTVFGGGSKMVLPGVSSRETIMHNHSFTCDAATKANYDLNPRRLDMDEAADLVGLDVNIEGLVNLWGETVALYIGALKPSHEAGVREAKSHYLTPKAKDKDIIIANTYTKVTEAASCLNTVYPFVKKGGGDVVLICNAPSGQVIHYLVGPWGENIVNARNIKMAVPPHINRLIVFTEYPDLTGVGYIEPSDKVVMLTRWDDVLKVLRESHGAGTKVGVYPNADAHYHPYEAAS